MMPPDWLIYAAIIVSTLISLAAVVISVHAAVMSSRAARRMAAREDRLSR